MFLWLALLISAALAAVDVNSADASTLESLPGIGPSKAAAIIAYREQNGPFKSVSDLDNVNGIGPSTLENIAELVSFGGAVAPTGAAPVLPTGGSTPVDPAPSAGDTPKSASAAGGCPVNVNAADAAGLKSLPGIGDSKAAAIVQYRTDNGPFSSCDGLNSVSGIGDATLAALRDCCVVK